MNASNRFRRLLLIWYPPRHRQRFGEGMLFAWNQERQAARTRGWIALMWFWLRSASHAVVFGLSERLPHPRRIPRKTSHGKARFAVDTLRDDLRVALRGLARTPAFTFAAVITLALGLGGTVAIFTVLNRVVLDPLPYPHPERLVSLTNRVPGVATDAEWSMSTAQFVYFSEQTKAFEGVGLYRGFGANIETPEGPYRTFGWVVTSDMFPLLGATALHGRLISPEDDRPGAPAVAVLSYGFWRRQFGADPSAIGRTFSVNDSPHEIIGVLNPGAKMPGAALDSPGDIWLPMQIDRNGYFGNNHVFPMIARLAPGVTIEHAENELAALTERLPERFPDAYSTAFFERYGFRTRLTPLRDTVLGNIGRTLWIVFGGVGLVLLIAVTNVANLFLVRVEGRHQELAVRRALGASGWALTRHLLAESCVLAVSGGMLALLVGLWGVPALFSLSPGILPRVDTLTLDAETVVFTLGLSLAVGTCLALYAVVQTRGSGFGQLISGERSATASRQNHRARGGLIVAQVALALTLTAGAGLLLQSMRRLNQIEPGFDSKGVVTAGIFLTPGRYTRDVDIWVAYQAMLTQVRAIPGVSAAGMTSELPVLANFGCTIQGFEDPRVSQRLEQAGLTTCAGQEPTSPGYFEAMRIPILAGRVFSEGDNDDPTRAAVVVSHAFAERFWPGEDPLGKGVMPSGRTEGPPYRVIGVVGDVPASSLDGDAAIAIYYPIVHNPNSAGRWDWWSPTSMSLVVKTTLPDPVDLAPQIRAAVRSVDPTVPVAHIASMETIVRASIARFRFTAVLLGVSAGMALVLAAVGLYGVVSYIVGRRTREIGIRIAVGAAPARVRWDVVRGLLRLVATGLLVGAGVAVISTRALRGLIFGVEPTDPLTLVAAATVLGVIAGLASWIPARRAARVDPVEALRSE